MPFSFRSLFTVAFALGTLVVTRAELTLETLKERQAQMRTVVRTAHPATVGILFPEDVGAGSGVLVSADGLVLTAAHVSGKAGRDVTVVLSGGERLPGKTLGAFRSLDAGMIQILAKNRAFPTVPLGDSNTLEIGQWCLAIGHPGGFLKERTAPVRLGRILDDDAHGFLVTDSTLVGGDSGGPLLDLQGRLIGIHSSIGYDLAENRHVPINAFQEHWDSMKSGEVTGRLYEWMSRDMPFLGVQVDPEETGVKVQRVVDGSPADKAGVRTGDVIVKLDGKQMTVSSQFLEAIRRKAPGDRVVLTLVAEGGVDRELEIRLGRLRDFRDQLKDPQDEDLRPNDQRPGFLGVQLTEENGNLVVVQVLPDSPAENADVQPGDAILQYGGQDVSDINEFFNAVGNMAPGDKLSLLLDRGGQLKRLEATLGAR